MLLSKKKWVFIPFLFIFIVCSVYAQEGKTVSGIVTEEVKTKDGTVKIFRTAHLPRGKTISGTIVTEPDSDKSEKQKKQAQKLANLVFKIGEITIPGDGVFAIRLPDSETVPMQVFNPAGGLIEEISLKLSTPRENVALEIPKTIRKGYTEKITGSFSGDISQAKLMIDEKPVDIVAGNENELFFETSDVEPGKQELMLDYEEVTAYEQVNVVDYTLEAGRLTLNRGESTHLDVKVVGLNDLQESLLLKINNQSIGTVSIEGGNVQSIEINPDEVTESGFWQKVLEIQGLRRGSFSVETNLEVIETPDVSEPEIPEEAAPDFKVETEIRQTDISEKPIKPEPSEHPVDIPIRTNENQLNFTNYLNGIPTKVENDNEPSFTDETTKPCDTLEVDFHIRSEVNLISQTICDLSDAKLDSLLKAIDEYEDATWKKDSLQGIIIIAEDFKSRLVSLKDKSVGKFRKQFDQLENLSADSENCAPGWKDDFYDRYVAPNSSSPRRNQIFERYVERYQRNFEKCVIRTSGRLEREKREQEKRFDNSYIEPITETIGKVSHKLSEAENKANEKEQKLLNKLRRTMAILCEVEVKWNALLKYMDTNMICIKCGEVCFSKPPELQIMDSCMSNFTAKLLARIGDIRQPLNTNVLQGLANDYFNLGEMDKNLENLDSLSNAFQQFLGGSGNVKMVHPCCERLNELAAGVYFYGYQQKSYSDMASAAKQYGLGDIGMIAVPANPEEYKNSSYKKQYRKDKRERSSQLYQIQHEIESILRKLKAGSNRGKNSSQHALKDETAMKLHGAEKAAPLHQQSADALANLLEGFLKEMENCYDQSVQNQRQRTYTEIMHRCFRFRLCLELLDAANDEYEQNREKALANLQQQINQLKQKQQKLKKEVEALGRRITNINNELRNLRGSGTVTGNSALNQRVQQLSAEQSDLRKQHRAQQNKINRLSNNLKGLQKQLNSLRRDIAPRPVANIGECEEIRNDIQDAAGDFNTGESELSRQINEIENDVENLEKKNQLSHENANDISDGITEVRDRVRNIEREQERRRLAGQRRRFFEDKAKCLRLLSEYWDSRQNEFCPLDSLAAAYETFAGVMENVPEGYSEIIDKLNDFNSKVADVQAKIERTVTLLNGVAGEPSDTARAAAFKEILTIAGEIGDRVPGFGEMIGYYAKAYERAIGAIMKISAQKVDAVKPLVDRYRVLSCPQPGWKNKSLSQILEAHWEDFMRSPGSGVVKRRLTDDEQEKLKEYFNQKVTNDILRCCLNKISEQVPGQ